MEPGKNIRGTIGTVIFHLGLVALMIILGFRTPLPLPSEEGILINFGTDEMGAGLIEPSESAMEEEKPAPEPEAMEESSLPEPEPEIAEEEIMTQDMEETVAIDSKKKAEADAEKKRLDKIKREKAEADAKAKAEADAKAKAEAEAEAKRLAEEKRIKEINDQAQNVFGGQNQNDNTSTGEGEGTEQGNQGDPSGSVDSKNRTGSGTGDKGVGYSLEGRSPVTLPLPVANFQEGGIVVVEVTVDRNGKVTKATPGVKGSTNLDEDLLKAAKEAALKAKFNSDQNAAAFQKGTITYHFENN